MYGKMAKNAYCACKSLESGPKKFGLFFPLLPHQDLSFKVYFGFLEPKLRALKLSEVKKWPFLTVFPTAGPKEVTDRSKFYSTR